MLIILVSPAKWGIPNCAISSKVGSASKRCTNNAKSKRAEETKEILTEYFNDFQERNPQLKVFSAHLHMDEETPHLHIDFVPFVTGSKRGLDTRVSLKQALFTQGFQGGSRNDTEWNQWVDSEKETLASVMNRYERTRMKE